MYRQGIHSTWVIISSSFFPKSLSFWTYHFCKNRKIYQYIFLFEITPHHNFSLINTTISFYFFLILCDQQAFLLTSTLKSTIRSSSRVHVWIFHFSVHLTRTHVHKFVSWLFMNYLSHSYSSSLPHNSTYDGIFDSMWLCFFVSL